MGQVKNLGEMTEIEPVMKVVLEEMRLRSVKSIVDVGCGFSCRLTEYFKGFDYTGVDKLKREKDAEKFPWAKFVWKKKVQDYRPKKPFDAAWSHCFFCLAEIDNDEMRVIVEWLRRWVKWIFLCDTPRLEVAWQRMLSDAGFQREAHGVIKDAVVVVEVWRNTGFEKSS